MSFDTWMTEVDRKVSATVGISVHDLSDQTFSDWWKEGMSPEEAVLHTLEDNDLY